MDIANVAMESNVAALAKTAVHQNETILSLQAELAAVQAQLHRPPPNLQANSATTPTSVMDMMVEAFKSSQPGK